MTTTTDTRPGRLLPAHRSGPARPSTALLTALLAAALAAVTLAACGSGSPKAAGAGVSTTGGSFPVTVTGSNGSVRVKARPTRVVSLSPTATQMLFSIGAGPQVVAVDEFSTAPAKAPHTKLDPQQASAEQLETYRPDLVVMAPGGNPNLVGQLGSLNVPALVIPPAKNLADEWSQYRQIGLATGHTAGADSEVAHLQSQLAAVEKTVGRRGRGHTYYIEFSSDLYTATSATFDGSLFGLVGMKNIADAASGASSGYPQLSAEYLIKANPEYVFLADDVCCGQSAVTFAARPGYSHLAAVARHHVYVINDSVASQWGPNVVEFLQDVAKALGAPAG